MTAHEYWLDPENYHPRRGDVLGVDIRNGEDFIGTSYPFDAERYRQLYRLDADGRHVLSGRLGDYPALAARLEVPGLQSVVLTTQPQMLSYDTFEEFSTFLNYHGLGTVKAVHRQRGLPETNITERYLRFAKTLVNVEPAPDHEVVDQVDDDGEARVTDQDSKLLAAQGLDFELVALSSPYSARETLELELLFKGRQLADAQVEVFLDSGGPQAERQVYRTDEQGRVAFATANAGRYLVNAVQVIQARGGAGAVHWESLWASLTFEVVGP